MRTYILSTLNSIRQYSKNLDAKAILYNKKWMVFNDSGEKEVMIFRPKNELLIVRQGIVQRNKWEILPIGVLMIETYSTTYLFNAAFVDNNFLALQLDGTDECMLMIESNYMKTLMLDTIDKIESFLRENYAEVDVKGYESKKENVGNDDYSVYYLFGVIFIWLLIIVFTLALLK